MAPAILIEDPNELRTAQALSGQPEITTATSKSTLDTMEPLAIVGFSLKFPQDATSSEAFWSMLMEKRCAMTEWPSDRLNIEAFRHSDKERNDTVCCQTS